MRSAAAVTAPRERPKPPIGPSLKAQTALAYPEAMPLFLDIHLLDGQVSVDDLHQSHVKDLAKQEEFGVRWLKYWFNDERSRVYCLVEAPDREAAKACHHAAHGMPYDDIVEISEQLAEAFLGGGHTVQDRALHADGRPDRGFRAILFTDIVGSTELTHRLGDVAAMAILEAHNEIVRRALLRHAGREVKHTGDGIMASFVEAAAAVRCAIDIQHELSTRHREAEDPPLRVRIGISAGEPVEVGFDLFGAAVQLAARTCDKAGPEEIFCSEIVVDACKDLAIPFTQRGDFHLKGVDGPVKLFEVPWE
jgi:class 3 adenylate cyclase